MAIIFTGKCIKWAMTVERPKFISCTQVQYKFNWQNDRTSPNSPKTRKKTQSNNCMGFRIPNLKNTIFQNFFPVKIGGRALTGGTALTPILNT